jgi:pimeloyl-ACP methyl ester carboxylesterase
MVDGDLAFTRVALDACFTLPWREVAAAPDMPQVETDRSGLKRFLLKRYHAGDGARDAVLLVHGASASSRTFLVPDGGLVRSLLARGIDVWTLDWRGSSLIASHLRDTVPKEEWLQGFFSIEKAAELELQAAVKTMYSVYGHKVAVIAHCVGGAVVGRGILKCGVADYVDRVVLTALGLFFRVGVENWFKGNERVLEGLLREGHFDGGWPAISPWVATGDPKYQWPTKLEQMFTIWQRTPVRHRCDNPFCHRVSFMFGMPYNPTLVERMHAVGPTDAPDSLEEASLEHGFWGQFGDMPLGLYLQVAESLRQGWLSSSRSGKNGHQRFLGSASRKSFQPLRLTLITGRENQLWHRESIDMMYEWLRRGTHDEVKSLRVHKYVAPGFGHQDMFWCENPALRDPMYDRLWQAIDPSAP